MHSRQSNRLFAVLLILFIASSRSELCFYPDGRTTSPDIPCNQSAVDAGGHTPCCNNYNMCLDNGLCMGNGIVSRGSCTDPNWGDACPQWCKNESKWSLVWRAGWYFDSIDRSIWRNALHALRCRRFHVRVQCERISVSRCKSSVLRTERKRHHPARRPSGTIRSSWSLSSNIGRAYHDSLSSEGLLGQDEGHGNSHINSHERRRLYRS